MSEQLVADIQATRKVLQEQGWDKGYHTRKPHEPCCLLIAVNRVTRDDDPRNSLLHRHLQDILATMGAPAGGIASVVLWNDEPDRTFDDVLALLDKAEAAAREQ